LLGQPNNGGDKTPFANLGSWEKQYSRPGHNCIAYELFTHTINDLPCSWKLPAICEGEKGKN